MMGYSNGLDNGLDNGLLVGLVWLVNDEGLGNEYMIKSWFRWA